MTVNAVQSVLSCYNGIKVHFSLVDYDMSYMRYPINVEGPNVVTFYLYVKASRQLPIEFPSI